MDAKVSLLLLAACVVVPSVSFGQGFTGGMIVTVTDEQGGVVKDASVRLRSTDGGDRSGTTGIDGVFRFLALRLGAYDLSVEHPQLAAFEEKAIEIGADRVLRIHAVLKLPRITLTTDVSVSPSRLALTSSGLEARVGFAELQNFPSRRFGPFGAIGNAPGMSRTSPSSGANSNVSAFGSSVNENLFNQDGTNFTCPCAGVSRAEPSLDFVQEVQVQSVGISPEYGNFQGSVFNVVTRQGGNRVRYDASYYAQLSALTAQPVHLPIAGSGGAVSGYERDTYRDFTTTLGGPISRDRLWGFGGYQHLRDYDSQPGTDPEFPRTYEQDKFFGKLNWQINPGMQLMHSLLYETWVNPEIPTRARPREATLRYHAAVPTMTFGHLTHAVSNTTLYEVRAGRFVFPRKNDPSSGDWTTPSHFDTVTGESSGNPPKLGALTLIRTTAKGVLTHYANGLGAGHEVRVGVQLEKGEHDEPDVIPGGERYVDRNGQPFQKVSAAPSNSGGQFLTGALFATDAVSLGHRMTINAGVRLDHSRAISQDIEAVDLEGQKTGDILSGLGTLYTWTVVSPRLGFTAALTADGQTMLRVAYGRFQQGVLTGEISPFHPGLAPVTTWQFDPATADYTTFVSTVDPKINLVLDSEIRAPRTDEFSMVVERELRMGLAAGVSYIHKTGDNFIAWTDVGGRYQEMALPLPDGGSLPVFDLTNGTSSRRFLLTNPAGYSLTYHGLVATLEKRLSDDWQVKGAYAYSRTSGLQASSGGAAGDSQASTIAAAFPTTAFGRDPNNLTNAYGRLANDRPHMLRVMGSYVVPRTGLVIAGNMQHLSGKPWAATAQVPLTQGDQRILIEPRGSRRLSSQSLLDLRLSRSIPLERVGRVELIFDLLNVLGEAAEESLVTDSRYTYRDQQFVVNPNFGRPAVFVDPRRAMISVRMSLGQ